MTPLITKGRIVTVTAEVLVPETVTEDELTEWVEHEGGQMGGIHMENPLFRHGWNVENIEWEDSGLFRETQITNVRKDGDSTTFNRRAVDKVDNRTDLQVGQWKSPEQAQREAFEKHPK